ncbi:MAG: TRAP transporter large permease subunit [Pseudomonadota bacterium]
MSEVLADLPFCACIAAGYLDVLLVLTVCALLLAGFPAAFTLAGTALLFALIGWSMGVFELSYLIPYPQRIFGATTNQVLIAVPLFIFMGVVLERAKIAEELLDEMAKLFGSLQGGLGVSVIVVGALLAASTGIVGATVVTMGLLSLPVMLKRGYDPALATGSIAAAGTLGQIIPPSIVLILLGDVISNAYQKAQLSRGVFAPDTVTVGDLFAGALVPGLLLVALYIAYVMGTALLRPASAPCIPAAEIGDRREAFRSALKTLPAPLILIVAVLGSILGGVATPTEAAAVGAVGALFLAGHRTAAGPSKTLIRIGAAALIATLAAGALAGPQGATGGLALAAGAGTLVALAGLGASIFCLLRTSALSEVTEQTLRTTTMVFAILIGAALFSLVFRGLGGDARVEHLLAAVPGGPAGALLAVMAVMFVLGFFLDFIEITLVVVPLVAAPLLAQGVDPVWLGVMMAVNLQTSFLTPPFGFALFYLRGVAPESVKTTDIYRGALPFVAVQIMMLGLLALFPALATWAR